MKSFVVRLIAEMKQKDVLLLNRNSTKFVMLLKKIDEEYCGYYMQTMFLITSHKISLIFHGVYGDQSTL